MNSLFLALYALVVTYRSGAFPKAAVRDMQDPEVLSWLEKLPSVLDALRAARAGSEVDYAAVGAELTALLASYRKDPSSSATSTRVLAAFAAWMKTGSPASENMLEKASATFPSWVSQAFVKEENVDQQSVSRELSSIVKRLAGYSAPAFRSPEDAKAAKLADPAAYARYTELRRSFTSAWKDAISAYVRNSGKLTVPMPEVEQYLASRGIEHGMSKGFKGNIDALGNWYDSADNLLSTVPSAALFPTVRMNTTGDGEWAAQAIRPDGSAQYIFRKADQLRNKQEKFERVRDFFPIVDNIRKKWVALIRAYDPFRPETVAAVILELIFQFSARVGTGRGNTGGESTFGVSSLLVKHCKMAPNGFILSYPGKDAVATRHKFVVESKLDQIIFGVLQDMVAEKSPKEPLFTYSLKNGSYRPVNSAVVNKLFRALGAPDGITVRNLRTYHGSRIFKEEMEAFFLKTTSLKSGAEALGFVKAIATKVGKALNHVRRTADGAAKVTPNTALMNYIDTGLQTEFFQHYGLPLPGYLERLTSVTASTEDTEETRTDTDTPFNDSFLRSVINTPGSTTSALDSTDPFTNHRRL